MARNGLTPTQAAELLRAGGYHDRSGVWHWLTERQARYMAMVARGRAKNPLRLPSYEEWDEKFGRELRLRPERRSLSTKRSSLGVRRAAYGFVLWEGPSALGDLVMRSHAGSFQHVRADVPLVCIAVFGDPSSANKKTGRMIQTYILVRDHSPTEAMRLGLDESNCGFCQHRKAGQRTCYVRLDQGTGRVWNTYRAGGYRRLGPEEIGPVFGLLGQQGFSMRLGTYGDPAAVPFWVWQAALGIDESGNVNNLPLAGTCYTHQWQAPQVQPLRSICMASVDTDQQREQAALLGWRSFQPVSMYQQDEKRPGFFRKPTDLEILQEQQIRRAGGQTLCPASEEFETAYGVHRTTCEACRLCSGGLKHGKKDIWIPIHGMGGGAAKRAARKIAGNPCPCMGACGCLPGRMQAANPLTGVEAHAEIVRGYTNLSEAQATAHPTRAAYRAGKARARGGLVAKYGPTVMRYQAERLYEQAGELAGRAGRVAGNPDEDRRRRERDSVDGDALAQERARRDYFRTRARPAPLVHLDTLSAELYEDHGSVWLTLTHLPTGRILFQATGQEAVDLVEQGFVDPRRDLTSSLASYLQDVGVLRLAARRIHRCQCATRPGQCPTHSLRRRAR